MKVNKYGTVSFWDNPRNSEKVSRYKRNAWLKQYARSSMTADQLTLQFNQINQPKKGKK